jgi:hypothetical protein
MTIAASVLINESRTLLLDSAAVTWSAADLLLYSNEAQRTIAFVKPDANPVSGNLELDLGTEQVIPSDGVALLDITENTYSGLRVTQVDRELLDETNRYWPVTGQQRDVQHFAADPRDPRRYSVTPPNDGTGEVRATYGAVPAELTSPSQNITYPDSYHMVIVNLILSRAYQKNSKKQDLVKSSAFFQTAMAMMGVKSKAQIAVAPKVSVSEGL